MTTLVGARNARQITLLGSPAEQAAGSAVIKELPPKLQGMTQNMAGKTDWNELVDVVDSLDVLLTPDTGTMHLAAHLGTPIMAFFLSSAWCFETGPYGFGHTVYQAVTDCLPCLETQPCNENLKCLNCFTDLSFQRFIVTGKKEHAPDNLLALTTSFDELGQIYTPFSGEDRDMEQRTTYRNFIKKYLSGSGQPFSAKEHELALEMYRETDWTTPEHVAEAQE